MQPKFIHEGLVYEEAKSIFLFFLKGYSPILYILDLIIHLSFVSGKLWREEYYFISLELDAEL